MIETYCYVFTRMAILFMLGFGFNEGFVMPRFRVMMAALMTILFAPMFNASNGAFIYCLCVEIFNGLMLGLAFKTIFTVFEIAGHIIDFHLSIGYANFYFPGSQRSSIMGTFLDLSSLVIMFSSGFGQTFIKKLAEYFSTYPPGYKIAITTMHAVSLTFEMALSLATPIWVMHMLSTFILSLINRSLQNLQIFVLLSPFQTMLGLYLLSRYMGDAVHAFIKSI